jgi:hypothetical protein
LRQTLAPSTRSLEVRGGVAAAALAASAAALAALAASAAAAAALAAIAAPEAVPPLVEVVEGAGDDGEKKNEKKKSNPNYLPFPPSPSTFSPAAMKNGCGLLFGADLEGRKRRERRGENRFRWGKRERAIERRIIEIVDVFSFLLVRPNSHRERAGGAASSGWDADRSWEASGDEHANLRGGEKWEEWGEWDKRRWRRKRSVGDERIAKKKTLFDLNLDLLDLNPLLQTFQFFSKDWDWERENALVSPTQNPTTPKTTKKRAEERKKRLESETRWKERQRSSSVVFFVCFPSLPSLLLFSL